MPYLRGMVALIAKLITVFVYVYLANLLNPLLVAS